RQYTPVGSTDFQTSEAGLARLEFTPPESGTYRLDISGAVARTELFLWVSGPGQAIWPNLPNQRLRLSADRQSYQPGETAQVFVPNPFASETLALVTVERGIVLRHQVLNIRAGGQSLDLPLSTEDAPNVYVSVLLLGRDAQERPDFRQGYLNLPVSPAELTLQVEVVSQPERAGPGEDVNFAVRITDNAGAPVQGEFSLSVVDKAVLALADPNVPDIVSAFYAEQPLGVRTGLSLAAYAHRLTFIPAGFGGGDGGLPPLVTREKFPDTAFWRASITTDEDGRAQVSMSLPDSLTSWQVLVRGVTQDTRVGEAEVQIVTTKEFIIRPVIPRFLVVDDRVQLAAVVQNNTQSDLQAEVALQAKGLTLEDTSAAPQQISVPALGRVRLEWWGSVQEADSVELIFTAEGRDPAGRVYQDAIRPASGRLPVLRFTAPQTFSTSGSLGAEYRQVGGELLEIVSLPRSYELRGGSLKVELSSSLAGAVLDALEVLEAYPYDCTEQALSRFLPNLEMYLALQQFGVGSPELKARLERSLQTGLERLLVTQNPDGGWSWWSGGQSDPFVSAYVLYGLAKARQAGSSLDELVIQRAVDYLYATLVTPRMTSVGWQLDRLAFIHFALAQAGRGDQAGLQALFEARAALNPWSRALLAVAMESLSPGSPDVLTLISDLEATAIRTATGVHWEESEPGLPNMSTTISTSAMVVYALAQRLPDSPLLADAVRYLMAHRQADGIWGSTYSTAWTILALGEVIKGTGELGGDFGFSANVNGVPLLSREGGDGYTPVTAEISISSLFPTEPNALRISRQSGPGSLYYRAALKVNRPVEDVAPLQRGISLSRQFYRWDESCARGRCVPLESIEVGEKIRVRLNITLENDAYYLMIEDYLPAGSEVLDTSLKTSQQGEDFIPEESTGEPEQEQLFDPRDPFKDGWGWWFFSASRIYDDHIAWSADYLPAGSYVLEFILVPLQAGEYRVLPARAWQFYFPEVQGNSAGSVFTINP
ncbi:MAG TPA: alpha-2-macroglobulin family protein, partial [Anaerolineales bacterium]|nr:alpha-2-macroglobulin family protein [Anaerolineales bacterium]